MTFCYPPRNLKSMTYLLALLSFVFWFLTPLQSFAQGAGNNLDFDGVDDYVTMGPGTGLNMTGDFTIEFWIYVGLGDVANNEEQVVVTYGADGETQDDNKLYQISVVGDGGRFRVKYLHESGAGVDESVLGSPLRLDRWHHVAVTRTASPLNVKIYYNGFQDKNFNPLNAPDGGGNGNFILAAGFNDLGTSGTTTPSTAFFAGKLDEIRIWNTAHTQSEIQSMMHLHLTGSEAGMLSYWRCDASSGTTLIDVKGSNPGTLTNGVVRETSTAPIGNFALTGAVLAGTSSGQVSETTDLQVDATVTLITSSGTTLPFSVVQVNASPNFISGLLTNFAPHHWILWAPRPNFNGNLSLATVKFHYDNIGGIGDESTLKLYSRADAKTVNWNEVTSAVVISNDGGSSTNTDGIGYIEYSFTDPTLFSGEFIITSDNPDNSLPVELGGFTASVISDGVLLEWVTFSEINNLGFELWRAEDEPVNFQRLDSYEVNPDLQGAGNSSTTHKYEYVDKTVEPGRVYYYQLWDVSYDGVREAGPILKVSMGDNNYLVANRVDLKQNYPNPFNPTTQISFEIFRKDGNSQFTTLDIYDIMGRRVRRLVQGNLAPGSYNYLWDGTNDFGQKVGSGTYFYLLKVGNTVVSRKMQLIK